MATTVSIGRNIPKHASGRIAPMSSVSWQRFQKDIISTIRTYSDEVYFVGQGVGQWAIREDSLTVVSSDIPNEADKTEFITQIGQLATKYHQEAIAVTMGQTELVGQA